MSQGNFNIERDFFFQFLHSFDSEKIRNKKICNFTKRIIPSCDQSQEKYTARYDLNKVVCERNKNKVYRKQRFL